MDIYADYKSDYLTPLNKAVRHRKPLFVDDDERSAYLSVLINLVWFTVATLLLGTVAAPLGVLMLIVFIFTSIKQITCNEIYLRFTRHTED